MRNINKYLGLLLLLFAVGFNLWIYRLEPTSKVDPNDNPFQFALVHRTNEVWDYAAKTCGINPVCFSGYLIDHWVPNWAQGYNLPYYYSHAPQIVIVASFRFLGQFFGITLYQWYHVLIYLLLCLFPISVFLALRVIRLPFIIAGIGAIVSSHISTDGLYGLDPSSFLWRGYGLTSQLFSMIWVPLAIAFSFRFFTDSLPIWHVILPTNFRSLLMRHRGLSKHLALPTDVDVKPRKIFWLSVLFLAFTISGHLGIGVMTLLSLGIIAITPLILGIFQKEPIYALLYKTRDQLIRLGVLASTALFFLSYWILPALIHNKYHNLSFWDPVWKFNSWGWKEVMQFFFNGALFDFGRFPILTLLLVIGAFAVFVMRPTKNDEEPMKKESKDLPEHQNTAVASYSILHTAYYSPFGFLFVFWLLMFFGRATWGGLLDIIPSMSEFHQSRFIVGLHLTSFFLIPIGFWWLAETIPTFLLKIKDLLKNGFASQTKQQFYTIPSIFLTTVYCLLSTCLIVLAFPQTSRYANHNDVLIKQGNDNFDRQHGDVDTLIQTLDSAPPGRVFTGRGGSWGKNLLLAETTYFMHLSTYGIPVILWLPETWSPNSDVEQFFIEERPEHYDLMNVKYVVTTPEITPQPFWEFMKETPQWKLYSVKTSGYFGIGSVPAVIESNKLNYINLVRLWLQSETPKEGLYPELTFDHTRMMSTTLPAFSMIDEATYQTRDGKSYGLFGDVPMYQAPKANVAQTGSENSVSDMEFTTTLNVSGDCAQCMVFLKQSFHPNWRAWVDGKRVEPFVTFPFYTAVNVTTPGDHTVVFKYQPSTLKMILFTLAGGVIIFFFFPAQKMRKLKRMKSGK